MKHFIKHFIFLNLIAILLVTSLVYVGSLGAQEKICVKWATPTPVYIMSYAELKANYEEWVPYPGTGYNSGKGWIKANDLIAVRNRAYSLRDVDILLDYEYKIIAKRYGVKIMSAGKEIYGFAPVQGYYTVFGGVTIKNEWLPKRLQEP